MHDSEKNNQDYGSGKKNQRNYKLYLLEKDIALDGKIGQKRNKGKKMRRLSGKKRSGKGKGFLVVDLRRGGSSSLESGTGSVSPRQKKLEGADSRDRERLDSRNGKLGVCRGEGIETGRMTLENSLRKIWGFRSGKHTKRRNQSYLGGRSDSILSKRRE